ncbi:3-ketoacyl-CoA thiolase [Trichoderma gamsii]|uniref:acetyl-CoA C-acyltransferase n=1 Tax=Trichoderma gamsii TaxID=398673 RepID=A0A2P4ZJV9_9HYPO|nr:3-ketoacyl-CoA thiolase [Trichoderma gamsii]PON24577.1 3-ketoacyl-CoA thiolase [Trichoderma gamsii]
MAHLRRGLKAMLEKSPDDIVFLSALRTPVTRSFKGKLASAHAEELLATVLQATRTQLPSLDPSEVSDVAVGTVLSELGGQKAGRAALLHAGYLDSTALYTVNRACSSGLQAVTNIADAIASGRMDMGIGGAMESMTRNYGSKAIPTVVWEKLRESNVQAARDCLLPMGITSENIARRYGISRADQDAFALVSHTKAAKAQAEGRFKDEIVPVELLSDTGDVIAVIEDDGIRPNASLEQLAKLKPAFLPDGASTAGNSSQVSDGASLILIARRSTATRLGLNDHILGKWARSAVAGVAPDEMGVGPAVVIPKMLQSAGISASEVNVWEINEAFASQALYCIDKLGIDMDKVNPNGGAIALGHPLGATGARQLTTLLHHLKRTGQTVGVVSMCIGTGMGKSALILSE